MTDALFDRYREALRAGHVAVMRGRLEDAAASYREATQLARDRVVPRTALGAVQLRLGEPELALATFDEALALVPTDDAALLGRAQAMVVLLRPDEAAATFDLLVEARRAAGKHQEACDALRHALEIQPTETRRELYRLLVDELRQAAGDTDAERALARAAAFLEASEAPEAREALKASEASDAPQAPEAPEAPVAEAPDAPPTPEAPEAPAAEPVRVVDGDALVLAAEEAAARGDAPGAVAAAMAAARAFRAAGHPVAALDACGGGLAAGPDDVDLHLLIAELALERGAVGPAGETYRNLLRLADIDGDQAARDRVLAAARAAFADDPRFAPG